MSFSKTISVVAALGSIFSVGLASWKISEEIKNEQTAPLEEKIVELEKKLEETKQPQVIPEAIKLPEPQPQPQVQVAPSPPVIPPPPPVAPSKDETL